MNDLFGKFLDAVVGELGSAVARISVEGLQALVVNSGSKEEKVRQMLQGAPNSMLKVHMIFSTKSGLPEKTLYIESATSFTPMLALQIKNSIVPGHPRTILMVGWGPGSTEKEIMSRGGETYYVKGNQVEMPSGALTIPED